ncbi:MAG: hypothetical protein R6U91_01640 [Bacillota bacterium]
MEEIGLNKIMILAEGAFVTQNIAQRHIFSSHAALVLSLGAVFAGIFSFLFWDKIFALRKFIGAMLICRHIDCRTAPGNYGQDCCQARSDCQGVQR